MAKSSRKSGGSEGHLERVLQRLEREVLSGGHVSWSELPAEVLAKLCDECAAAGWALMLRSSPMGLSLRLYPPKGDPVVIGPKDVDEMTGSILAVCTALSDERTAQGTPG